MWWQFIQRFWFSDRKFNNSSASCCFSNSWREIAHDWTSRLVSQLIWSSIFKLTTIHLVCFFTIICHLLWKQSPVGLVSAGRERTASRFPGCGLWMGFPGIRHGQWASGTGQSNGVWAGHEQVQIHSAVPLYDLWPLVCRKGNHFCGGSLVNARWVISTKQCFSSW